MRRLSSEQLPDYLKKSRTTVYEYLALARLPAELQSMSARADMGLKHWLLITRLSEPEDQVQLAQECAEKGYSVRELQARVKKLLTPAGTQTESQMTVEEETILGCQLVFKGNKVVVKPRCFELGTDTPSDYATDIQAALMQFVTRLNSRSTAEVASPAA